MRSAGISLWRIVGWVIRPAMVLVLLSFVLSEWVIPYTNEQAKSVKSHRSVAELGEVRGYWSREGNRFIYIDYANAQGQLKNVQVVDFDDNYRLRRIIVCQIRDSLLKTVVGCSIQTEQMDILQAGNATLAKNS